MSKSLQPHILYPCDTYLFPVSFLVLPILSLIFQSLSLVRLFVDPWTTACQASLSFTISQSLLKFIYIESVVPSNHFIFYCLLLLLPSIFSIISIHSFPMCWLFASENEVTQSCPTLCDPMNGSLPGFSIHGIFQARIVESVAISFSRETLGKLDQVFHMGHPPCVRGYPVSTQATSPSQGVTAVILHCQFILQSFGASASVLFTLY